MGFCSVPVCKRMACRPSCFVPTTNDGPLTSCPRLTTVTAAGQVLVHFPCRGLDSASVHSSRSCQMTRTSTGSSWISAGCVSGLVQTVSVAIVVRAVAVALDCRMTHAVRASDCPLAATDIRSGIRHPERQAEARQTQHQDSRATTGRSARGSQSDHRRGSGNR
jgi:hypothetical protein